MEFQVNTNNVILSQINQAESGEYNVTECKFSFSSEYDGLTKIAVFTGANGEGDAYKLTILNNKCEIPTELLAETQIVQIGVYAYDVDGTELILRYSPMPTKFFIHKGSFVVNAVNMSKPTATEVEQLQSQITHNRNDIDELEATYEQYGTDINELKGEVAEIKAEQTEQNTNIQKNTDDIVEINQNISAINTDIGDLEQDINVINQNIDDLEQDLTNYSLVTETGSQINLNVNSTNYQITAILKDKNGNVIYTSNAIDLPIESMIVNARYDNTTKEIVLTFQNGNTLRISVADLISGLVSEDSLQTILANYYTKTEVDNLLSVKANQSSLNQTNQNLTNLTGRVSTNETDISAIKTEQTTQNTNIDELQTQVETLQEDLDNANSEIAELNTDITNMRKAMITVEGQGTDITLENTSENKLVEFELSGQTSQDTSKIVYICDGTETGDYYFTYNNINYQFTMPTVSSGDILVFNTTTLVLSLNNTAITTETGTTGTELTFLTTPNSSYECPIRNVTGNANVKIQNKNLAWTGWAEDCVSRINNTNDTTIINYSNKRCLKFLPNTGYGDYDNKYIYKMSFKENMQYTFVFDFLNTTDINQNLVIHYTDGTKTNILSSTANTWKKAIIVSQANKTIKYITSAYYTGTKYIDLDTFMVLEGAYTAETIPEYVEHQEQNLPFTFAEGQRGMQGTKLLDDGIHNARRQVILNGTENWLLWSKPSGSEFIAFYMVSNYFKNIKNNGKILCNYFKKSEYGDFSKEGIAVQYSATARNCSIVIRRSELTSLDASGIKQWLSTHNLLVEFELSEEAQKTEIIPYNATQQAQYNAIKEATSYDDITYISSESDELSFNMNVVAVANANKVIDTQNNEIDTIKSRLDLLEG